MSRYEGERLRDIQDATRAIRGHVANDGRARIEIDRILEIVDRDLPALERAVDRLLGR